MKKIGIKDVEELFALNGYKIADGEIYKGSNIKMLCYNKDGYKVMLSRDGILANREPLVFSVNNPYTIDNIKRWLKLNEPEYELLSTEYKGKESKMEFRLKDIDLPPYIVTWGNFYHNGTRHPHFRYDKISEAERHGLVEVRKRFEEHLKETDWYLPVNEEIKYKNMKTKLRVSDLEGYISEISLGGLEKGRRPKRFHKNLKETSTYNMIKFLNENTKYKLKDGQIYRGNDVDYVFICSIHGEFSTKWVIIQNGHECMDCYTENNRGENHPSWNPNLSNEDRLYLRKIDGYNNWRKEVYKRDKYMCVSCGKRGDGDLVAHHLDGYSWCEEKRIDVDNGVTLCELCHTAFHEKYGYGSNTRAQFEEWLKIRGDIETIKKNTKIKKWKKKQKELPMRKSGIVGIIWERKIQKWRVRPKINGKLLNGGYYEDLEMATIKLNELKQNI